MFVSEQGVCEWVGGKYYMTQNGNTGHSQPIRYDVLRELSSRVYCVFRWVINKFVSHPNRDATRISVSGRWLRQSTTWLRSSAGHTSSSSSLQSSTQTHPNRAFAVYLLKFEAAPPHNYYHHHCKEEMDLGRLGSAQNAQTCLARRLHLFSRWLADADFSDYANLPQAMSCVCVCVMWCETHIYGRKW